jgi:hypothetical protein
MKLFNYYKIVRKNFGWYKRKYGIIFKTLKSHHHDLLKENRFIKRYSEDDRFIQIILRISDMEQENKNLQFFWYNPLKDAVTTKKEIEMASNEVDWNCAICEAEIVSKMNDFSTGNFLCNACKDAFEGAELVDERITESSIQFTKHCKKVLKRQQRDYMLFVKRNKRRN